MCHKFSVYCVDLFCVLRGTSCYLFGNNQSGVIEAFNSALRYLRGILNIDNPYLEQLVIIYISQISIDTEATFLDLKSFQKA